MSICETKPNEQPTSLTESDQNASEIAKIKRTRDQAYFNSYDFDAINDLPSNVSIKSIHEDTEKSINQNVNTTTANTNVTFEKNYNKKQEVVNDEVPVSKSHSYFERLKSLLSSSTGTKNNKTKTINRQLSNDSAIQLDCHQVNDKNNIKIAKDDENVSATGTIERNSLNNSSNSSSNSTTNLYKGSGNLSNVINKNQNIGSDNSEHSGRKSTVSSGFILPRAILKYQNIEYSVNSMPSSSLLSSSSLNTNSKRQHTNTEITPQISYYQSEATTTNKQQETQSDHGDEYQKQQQQQQELHEKYHEQFIQRKLETLQQLQSYSLNDTNDASFDTLNSSADQISQILPKTFTTSAAVHQTTESDEHKQSMNDNDNNDDDNNNNDDHNIIRNKMNSNSDDTDDKNRSIEISTCVRNNVAVKEISNDIKRKSTKYSEILIRGSTSTSNNTTTTTAAAADASQSYTKTLAAATVMQRQSSQNYSEKSSDRSSSDQTNILSHYSTERSNGGSSGYYSTNLCSASSIEEHIYSEPVIENLVGNINGNSNSQRNLHESIRKNNNSKTIGLNTNNKKTIIKHNQNDNVDIDDNDGRSRTIQSSSSLTSSQKLYKIPKGLTMNTINHSDITTISNDNFYMTNRSFNETFVGSGRRYFNNSSLKRSKYLQQQYQQQHQQHQQGQRHGLYHNDNCPEYTVNYVFSSGNNSIYRNHNNSNIDNNNHYYDKNRIRQQYTTKTRTEDDIKNVKMNESLKNLETSIENLDRHLKNYPHLRHSTLISRSRSYGQSSSITPPPFEHPSDFEESGISNYNGNNSSNTSNGVGFIQKVPQQSSNVYLPTIMEGIDSQSSITKKNQQKSWSDDMLDDSLMDIDLDSFLLVNENQKNNNNANSTQIVTKQNGLNGIDNPTFDANEILSREPMENNYKCSKYINSCPEDAYKVESELEHDLPEMIGNASFSNDKQFAFFLKKYEDQIHFQNTRDMLEDIQVKIRNIAEIAGEDDRVIPKAIENNINMLKIQLEQYLSIMNRNSEMELKQFCTGVVNNQKLVTLTKAFERRRSSIASCCNSEFDYDINYESVPKRSCCGGNSNSNSNMSAIIVNGNSNHLIYDGGSIINDDNHSLYGSPNRHRSISINDKLNYNDLYRLENGEFDQEQILNGNRSSISGKGSRSSQMQKNLSYHSPFLKGDDIRTENDDKNSILEWHRNKPSSWELYYGTNRMNHTVREYSAKHSQALMSYPSSRPESDFTLDLPRAEQLRLKMDKEKKFRQRCRILTTFLSLVFFLLTVMVVSLVLTRGKRMFGSML